MRIHAITLALLLSACVDAEDPATTPINGPAIPGHEMQGRHLLGGLDDYATASEAYWVSGNASRQGAGPIAVEVTASVLTARQGQTVWSGDDPGLIGIRFSGVDGSDLEITGVVPAAGDDPTAYLLQYRINGGGWVDPCAGETALPIAGRYDLATHHLAPVGDITFACYSGVGDKCIRWGYLPGEDELDWPWELHQACTHFANADYDNTGSVGTHEGTYVSMFDAYGVRAPFQPNWTPWRLASWPPPLNEFYIEAAWPANAPARCLSKARWASIPTGTAPSSLPDPRTDNTARYCEDYSDSELNALSNIMIISTSMYNDLPLVQWRNVVTGERLSTIRGYYDPLRGSVPPFPMMSYVGISGVILRQLTAELDPKDLATVRLYCTSKTSTECVVTTAGTKPTSHPNDRGFEGYVFKASRAHTIPLRMYKNAATGDYVTSTFPIAGYTSTGLVGWVMEPVTF